jgi:hypothetical protein
MKGVNMKKICICTLIIMLLSTGIGLIMHASQNQIPDNDVNVLLEIISPGVVYADTTDDHKPPPPPPIDG